MFCAKTTREGEHDGQWGRSNKGGGGGHLLQVNHLSNVLDNKVARPEWLLGASCPALCPRVKHLDVSPVRFLKTAILATCPGWANILNTFHAKVPVDAILAAVPGPIKKRCYRLRARRHVRRRRGLRGTGAGENSLPFGRLARRDVNALLDGNKVGICAGLQGSREFLRLELLLSKLDGLFEGILKLFS